MFSTVLLIVHVLVAIALVSFVLLQHGKGADAGAGFGAGSSGTVFGSQGSANFLSRTTAILAAVFFVTSLTLAFLSGQTIKVDSVMDSVSVTEPVSDVPAVDGDRSVGDVPAVGDTAEAAVPVDVPAIEAPVEKTE